MNFKRAKERFWMAVFIESPVAKNPLGEFMWGLFEEEEEQQEKKDAEE